MVFFKNSGVSNPFLITIAITTINMVMTLPGMWGAERFGRRRLLLVGAAGMCIREFLVAIIGVTISTENIAGQNILIASQHPCQGNVPVDRLQLALELWYRLCHSILGQQRVRFGQPRGQGVLYLGVHLCWVLPVHLLLRSRGEPRFFFFSIPSDQRENYVRSRPRVCPLSRSTCCTRTPLR